MKRFASCAIACLMAPLLLIAPVTAAPPVQIQFQFDETFPNGFLTDLCRIPVYVHLRGGGTTTLFYDQGGSRLIRELDTLAPGATTTIFSPVELGGTGKSFTDTTRSPATFLYPAGTAIGAPVTLIFEGLQRTSGPGGPRLVGREVYQGVIIGYTPDGVPIADVVALISQTGQFDLDAVLQARCARLTGS